MTNTTHKRLPAILLAALMLVLTCSMCFTAFATDESGGCGSGLTWTYNDATKTLTISGNGAMNDYKSSGSDGLNTLTTNAPWFSHRTEITRVVIGDGVTKIGKNAFRKLTNLTKIELPNSVEIIGQYSFSHCTSLVSATFGTGLKSIDAYAFNACTSLKTFSIPNHVESNADYAFYKCPVTDLSLGYNVRTIGSYAFSQCKLVNVTMYNKVEVIGQNAFAKQNNSSTDIISHIYYYGTETDWNSIAIGQNNEPLTGAQLHFEGASHTHSYTSTVTKAATCSETGVRTYTCACGDSYTETIAIDPANHVNTTNVGANASTCTVHGYSAGVYCNDCKQYISGHQQQPLAAHRTELRNARAADCLNAGYTGNEFCTVCQQTISYGHSENALGHTAPNADGNCTRCGAHIKDVEPTPQPEPKLNFFQRIIQWFRNLFARLFGR
ncbi:MAG: leucine-rich repeat domain-containing protein [Clostridia bacterium]|nr:leucine-rich repeat domain-containing protein [Clostridia bacterium]